jgi:hypothetical protein
MGRIAMHGGIIVFSRPCLSLLQEQEDLISGQAA